MRKLYDYALAAKAIKTELKKAFPTIKFSVKSESFAGGNAVRISWTDGPIIDRVTDITDKYQYGHFDGMNDIYEYSNGRSDIPQAKYVTTSRSMSETAKNEIADMLRKHYVCCENAEENDYIPEMQAYFNTLVYREFCTTDYETEFINFEKELLS